MPVSLRTRRGRCTDCPQRSADSAPRLWGHGGRMDARARARRAGPGRGRRGTAESAGCAVGPRAGGSAVVSIEQRTGTPSSLERHARAGRGPAILIRAVPQTDTVDRSGISLRLAAAFGSTPAQSTAQLLLGNAEPRCKGLQHVVGCLASTNARLKPQVGRARDAADSGQFLEGQPGGEAQSEHWRVLLVDVEQGKRLDREGSCNGDQVPRMRLLLATLPLADPAVTGTELLGQVGLEHPGGLAQLGDVVTKQPRPHRSRPSDAVPSARLLADSSGVAQPRRTVRSDRTPCCYCFHACMQRR